MLYVLYTQPLITFTHIGYYRRRYEYKDMCEDGQAEQEDLDISYTGWSKHRQWKIDESR